MSFHRLPCNDDNSCLHLLLLLPAVPHLMLFLSAFDQTLTNESEPPSFVSMCLEYLKNGRQAFFPSISFHL
ncbi:hypothetical protein M6B38_337245 [Iris pallida]|uniref:Uncharacterized protein n=1 Tax=Iris pallida TaxID=29817 RepID=A0AAX6H0B6_IRIPA|nr:hypothetical protein M6B38_337245 [Iris pallida]